MGKKLYVGNLDYSVTSADLQQLFAQNGTVESADVIMDKMSGRSKGFGFVEMATQPEAEAAIKGLNEQPVDGRNLKVNFAKPKEPGRGMYDDR